MPKFIPRQRKHKVLQREQNHNDVADPNTAELVPASKAEREARRLELKAQLRAQQLQNSKTSRQKQKRLDKYIDTKLRKEENLELLKRLAEKRVDTSLLHSSKHIGRARESRREALSRALRERHAGIDVEKNDAILLQPREARELESNSEDASSASEAEKPATTRAPPVQAWSAFGSGLKRPLEVDDEGKPVIKKRKRAKGKRGRLDYIDEESEWEGFSDSGHEGADIDGITLNQLSSATSASPDSVGSLSEVDVFSSEECSSDASEADEEDGDTSIESSEENGAEARKERLSAFKAWANQKKNEVVGFTPSGTITEEAARMHDTERIHFTPRPVEVDPLPPELDSNTVTDATRKAFGVHVDRSSEVQEARLVLPVVAEEQKIMEAIHNNDCVVVWGATGSGKTTQVPQFLYEAGYGAPDGPTPGMIGVTQPRRVAAVSMSKRVGDELGSATSKVAYQIRFDTTVDQKTAIKFMTDGVLLREIAQDFALTKYSAIVIDEAHERSVNTDILIGMMSRIVDLRANMAREDPKTRPLKLVIMSATLRISDFTENQALFRTGPPPLLQAEGRQYPVSIHFARRTQRDYLEETFRKVRKGHRQLPPGGMLVFLTGQNEITTIVKRLKQTFASTQAGDVRYPEVRMSAADAPLENEDIDLGPHAGEAEDVDGSDAESEILGLDDDEDAHDFKIEGEEKPKDTLKVHVLPLYAQLPTHQQLRVFEPPPDGSRLIVLATNVAETSLTIPGIRYVFDCGRSKERTYDRATGVQSFDVGWISQASASQRAGRAGRTGPGHCYRLYSSAVYERDFAAHASPEILRTPIEGIVLQLKSMALHHVVNFPFPTPPDRSSLARAERLLTHLGALGGLHAAITPAGRELALYPLSPRFGRMLVLGQSHGCAAHAIALVAALAIPNIFIPENQLDVATAPHADGIDDDSDKAETIRTEAANRATVGRERRRQAYNSAHAALARWDTTSDALKLLTALCAYLHTPTADRPAFCARMFLRPRALHEAAQLRSQLASIVRARQRSSSGGGGGGPASLAPDHLPPPSTRERGLLRQLVAAGFVDQVAQRADASPTAPVAARRPTRAIDVPYVTLIPSQDASLAAANADYDDETRHFVYVHPSSTLARASPASLPRYVVYSALQRSSSSANPRVRMLPLGPVSGEQLAALAKGTPLLEWGKPVGKIEELPREGGRERRACWVVPSLVGRKGTSGWPLPARRVVQRREGREGWVVETEVEGSM